MADGIVFEVSMAPLLLAVAHALSQAQHPRALMQNIGGRMVSNINMRFIERVDPDGHAWLPLSPKTIARKQKQGKSTLLMLYNEGEMPLKASNRRFLFVAFSDGRD